MTFTMQVKDEMSKIEPNSIDALTELSAFIRFDGTISKDEILLTMENASVARRIYKLLKTLFNVKPNIMVRVQKRFRVKQIYMLSIKENVDGILEKLNIKTNYHEDKYFSIRIFGKEAVKFLDWVYEYDGFKLNRKYEKYLLAKDIV